uniref:Transcription factor IIIC subunit 5 HTH domain-containing protein n=1 Tax=Timema tahoe TaxID=61484 RepID=A0A7R9P1V2_9NEOP|nr:unnamed protein product [Timema tahoe]
MHQNGDQNVCEYDQMVPSGMPNSDWLLGDTPLFLTPPAFSRMDTMQSYLYRKEASDEYDTAPHNIIGRTRRRRSGHAVFVSFEVPDTPRAPREIALQLLSLKFLSEKHLEKIHKLFEERPVWSKNALRYLTRFTNDQLKYLLPAVAYYFVTGPWRVMWVRFGYDPRTQPEARMYQTLDYRLRAKGGLRTKVKAKRSYCDYLLPYKSTPSCKPKMAVIGTGEDVPEFPDSGDDKGHLEQNMYIFRPGMMPPSRQMFYQYCDVLVPEIQDMLEKLPEPQSQCHEKLGWMPPRFDDRCREILNAEILKSFHTELSGGTISTEMMVADDSP